MHHDFSTYHGGDGTPGTGPCDGKGIMSYGSKEHYQWSNCSRSDFHLHYWALKWGNGCLEDISGNKMLEIQLHCLRKGKGYPNLGCRHCLILIS